MSFCMTIPNSRANYLLTVKGTSHTPATKLFVERSALYLKSTNNHRSKSTVSQCARCIVHTRWMVPPGCWWFHKSKSRNLESSRSRFLVLVFADLKRRQLIPLTAKVRPTASIHQDKIFLFGARVLLAVNHQPNVRIKGAR